MTALYVGAKLVKAEPMSKYSYCMLRGWLVPAGEDPAEVGYLVEYMDGGKPNIPGYAGYVSWAPADVFEQSYRASGTMGFGQALELLLRGNAIARAGWNGNKPKTGFVPPSRAPVVFEGLCYILLANGEIAYCDAEDCDLIAHQENWTLMGNGYPSYTDNQADKTVKLHQLILPDCEMVDHENGNKLDNRRRNLRPCTTAQNNANRAPLEGKSSAFKGVTWDKSRNKWMAAIAAHGASKTLGRFDVEEDAARAYDKAATQTYGQFARLNFPTSGEMFAYLVPASSYLASTAAARAHFGDQLVPYNAYMALKGADGRVSTWAPSGSDCLADDWTVHVFDDVARPGQLVKASMVDRRLVPMASDTPGMGY